MCIIIISIDWKPGAKQSGLIANLIVQMDPSSRTTHVRSIDSDLQNRIRLSRLKKLRVLAIFGNEFLIYSHFVVELINSSFLAQWLTYYMAMSLELCMVNLFQKILKVRKQY